MKKTIFWSIILIVFALWTEAGALNEETRAIRVIKDLSHESGKLGQYRALIIGIDDYNDKSIPPLKTAVNDAKTLAEVLSDRYGFKVELILDHKATKEALYKALRNLAESSKPDESVLIYYAGHGDLDRTYNAGWWIPVDAKGGDPFTYLDNIQVQDTMRAMKSRHVLLVSDSCYSGTLFGRARTMPSVITEKYYLDLYNEKSRWGMTSGNKTPVSDEGTAGHSIFAYQLLKELKKNEKPYLTTQEIYTRIAPIVSNNADQTPLCSPVLNTGDQGGEFVFVASSGAAVYRDAVKEKTLLSVEGSPTGAKVYIDSRYMGAMPLKDVEVSPGEHRLRVSLDGYDDYRRPVEVEKGRSVSMYIELSPVRQSKSRLYVNTEPGDADVKILNIVTRFYQGIELEPDRYTVEASAAGYEKKEIGVDVASGEDKRVSIRLEPVEEKTFSNSINLLDKYSYPKGLVAHYKFDEKSGVSLRDSLGNYNGKIYGAIVGKPGKLGNAYSFIAGTTNRVCFESDAFNFTPTDAFSFSVWIKPNLSKSNVDKYLIHRIENSRPWHGYDLYYRYRQDGTKKFTSNMIGSISRQEVNWNYDLINSQWYHVALTYNGYGTPNGLNLYINGELIKRSSSSGSVSGNYPSSLSAELGGRVAGDLKQAWFGLMDDAGVWNRVLTESEIEKLYNNGSGLTYNPNN